LRSLIELLTSPVAVARVTCAMVAITFASQAGVWFPDALLANIAIIYSGAYFIAMMARFGGDPKLSRELLNTPGRTQILSAFLYSVLFRFAVVSGPALFVIWRLFAVGPLEAAAILLLAGGMLMGNAMRISVSPNFQIGYDSSSFSACVLVATVLGRVPFEWSVIGYSTLILAVYTVAYARWLKPPKASGSFRGFSSPYYFASEMGYFILAYSIPALLVLVTDKETAGAIRSIEQVVVAGTFVLLLTNNRLFYDLSMQGEKRIAFSGYLKSYALPSSLFFGGALLAIVAAATAGFVPNVAKMPEFFILYAIAYAATAVCGSAGVYLNFAGEERFVTTSVVAGLVPIFVLGVEAFQSGSPLLLVLGSAIGTVVTNLIQLGRLYTRLRVT
jgi:hypothetical protein